MENLNLIPIDFEFNEVSEEILNLVCCSFVTNNSTMEYWLLDKPNAKKRLKSHLQQLKNEEGIFLGYQVVAEARSFYSLSLNPMDFEWIDLFLEYRCLTNHYDDLMYGDQLVDGKVKKTKRPPPKWERVEKDVKMAYRPTHSLAEATYKLTGQIRDTDHKKKMRDIIINGIPQEILENELAIKTYCSDDVEFLTLMFEKIVQHYKDLLGAKYDADMLLEEMLYRGKYAALTAIRESKGYPIDYEATRNFSRQIPLIMSECQRDINAQFPDIKPFRYNLRERKFEWNQVATRKWLQDNVDTDVWMKTDKKALSLSKDAFEKYFNYRHNYPRGNFGAQMLRYLKLKQSLNGFKETRTAGRKIFWDYVGKDKIVRPYMNIYGSQSSRSQPAATGFIPLKPAWTRCLIQPPKGKVITGIDYGSEEFFISALMSEDENMIDSYLSGDVYLAFAKLAGMVPEHGTKAKYKKERNTCKSTVLGLSYDMTKYGLARKLTADTGEEWDEDAAQEMIDLFWDSYPDFADWKQGLQDTYEIDGRFNLTDGWYMWGDNDNKRSIGNFPIQGMGAAIMRKADFLCHQHGLYVPFTLHDALYIMHDYGDWDAIDTAMDCMQAAFQYFFDGKYSNLAGNIRLDTETWGPDLEEGSIKTPAGHIAKTESIHIDERAIDEYNKFKKYFEPIEEIF